MARIGIWKKRTWLMILTVCFLATCCAFLLTLSLGARAEEAGQFEVKNVLFADNGDYLGKPSYIVTVQPTSPFPLPGQTNLQWAGSGDESVRANIVINDYTVGEIESFNTQVVQVHRYTTEIVIYIYDGCGNLPCGEHATNAECTCEDKRPVLLLDGTDVLVFKAGLTTGGLAASAADSVWGLKYGRWWKDGNVQEGGWKPGDQASQIDAYYDFEKVPELPFFAQRMTRGKAVYSKTSSAEGGVKVQMTQANSDGFTVRLLNDDGEGISVRYFSTDEVQASFEVNYLFEEEDPELPEPDAWSENFGGRWQWESSGVEWTVHSLLLKRVDGYMRIYVDNIEVPMVSEISYFHYMDLTALTVSVECDGENPGEVWLGEVEQDPSAVTLAVSSLSAVDFNNVDYQAVFSVNFSAILGGYKINLHIDDYFVQNYIKINGYSVKELNDLVFNAVQVHRNGATLQELNFYISNVAKDPSTGNVLASEEKELSIELLCGFATNRGAVLEKSSTFFYNTEYDGWYPVKEFLLTEVNTVEYDWLLESGLYAIQVGFADIASDTDIYDVSKTKAILDGIVVDGKPLRQIAQELGSDAIGAHWIGGRLHLYVASKDGSGQNVEPHWLEFTTDLVTPNGNRIASNQLYEHKEQSLNDSRECWVERPNEEGVVFEELQITDISAPSIDTIGSFQFYVTFNKPIAERAQLFLQGDAWWQVAAGIRSYDEARLNNLAGVGESVREKLFFGRYVEVKNEDGTTETKYQEMSVFDMLNAETNLGFQQVSVQIHMGDGALNLLSFIIAGTYDSQPFKEDFSNKSVNAVTDANQVFTLRIEKGFRSLLGGETKESVKYIYDPQIKTWVEEGETVGEDSAKIVHINYNGHQIADGTVIAIGEDEMFDPTLLYVELADPKAVYEVVGEKELSEGKNEFLVKIRSSTGEKENEIRFFLEKSVQEASSCSSSLNSPFAVWSSVALIFAVAVLVIGKRKVK